MSPSSSEQCSLLPYSFGGLNPRGRGWDNPAEWWRIPDLGAGVNWRVGSLGCVGGLWVGGGGWALGEMEVRVGKGTMGVGKREPVS